MVLFEFPRHFLPSTRKSVPVLYFVMQHGKDKNKTTTTKMSSVSLTRIFVVLENALDGKVETQKFLIKQIVQD